MSGNLNEKNGFTGKEREIIEGMRLVQRIARKGGRLAGFIVSFLAWFFLFMGFLVGFWMFYIDDRILFVFPGLAEKAGIEELITNPDKYDDRWVRVEGELGQIKHFSSVLVPPGFGPKGVSKPSQGSAMARDSAMPEFALNLYHFSRRASRTVSFRVSEKGRVVEVAGEFEKSGLVGKGRPYLDAAVMVQPRQHEYWIPIELWIAISLVIMAFSIPFFILSKGIRNAVKGPLRSMKEVLPEKISLQKLGKEGFFQYTDKSFFNSVGREMVSLGFKTIAGFTVPEMSMAVYFIAFHHPGKGVYSAVMQCFQKDVEGKVSNEVARFVDMVTMYPDASNFTTTNNKITSGRGRPAQLHYHIMKGAAPSEMFHAHLEERRKAVKQNPLSTSPDGFKVAFIESYIIERTYRAKKGWVSREEVMEIASRMGLEEHVDLATKLLQRDVETG